MLGRFGFGRKFERRASDAFAADSFFRRTSENFNAGTRPIFCAKTNEEAVSISRETASSLNVKSG
jgi:hypothetical protein